MAQDAARKPLLGYSAMAHLSHPTNQGLTVTLRSRPMAWAVARRSAGGDGGRPVGSGDRMDARRRTPVPLAAARPPQIGGTNMSEAQDFSLFVRATCCN